MAIKVERYVPLTSSTAPKSRGGVSAGGGSDYPTIIRTFTVMRDELYLTTDLRMTDYD